jgi:hypothetical protein
MKCYFCGKGKLTGGAWVSYKNPCVFADKGIVVKINHIKPEGHALCMILDKKGMSLDKNSNLLDVNGKRVNS